MAIFFQNTNNSDILVLRIQSLIYVLSHFFQYHTDGLVQDDSNSIANAMELLQSCTKIWNTM